MFSPFSPDRLERLAVNRPTKILCKRRYSVSSASSVPSLSPSVPSSPTLRTPPDHAPTRDAAELLLPVILSRVQHISTLDARHSHTPLSSEHITNLVHGDRQVLQSGEAALSVTGGRPRSATRAVASNPAQYGAHASLPSAMALAHAHCALHDLFICDARLAPDASYHDIIAPFVTALTNWPAVVVSLSKAETDTRIFELLKLPHLSIGSGLALGLRCDSVELCFSGIPNPTKGVSLVPSLLAADVVWATSKVLVEGWFPWLFVEPLGLCGDVAQAYVHNLGAMRVSLAMYNRLYECARLARPTTCMSRPEATQFAYGVQTCGTMWRVYAMSATADGSYPVTIIWSGCVNDPKDLTLATAILRQIGAEAKIRLQAVCSWLACICGSVDPGSGPVTPTELPPGLPMASGEETKNAPKLPPGIPIRGLAAPKDDDKCVIDNSNTKTPTDESPPVLLSDLPRKPSTQPPTRDTSPSPTSLKPWLPAFLPQRSASTSSSNSRRASPSPLSHTHRRVPSKVGSNLLSTYSPWPRSASASDVNPLILPTPPSQRPTPLPFPLFTHQQRPSFPPPSYFPPTQGWTQTLQHPTPKPFQYSQSYNYSWPALASSNHPETYPARGDRQASVWTAARQTSITISYPKSKSSDYTHSRKVSAASTQSSGASCRSGRCTSGCDICRGYERVEATQ